MGEAERTHQITPIKLRLRKVLLDVKWRALFLLKILMLGNSELLKTTKISLPKSLLNEFKKVHICVAHYDQH